MAFYPNVHFGYGSYEKISDIIRFYSPQKIFFATGIQSFSSLSLRFSFEKMLHPYPFVRFCEISNPPQLGDICLGLKRFKENQCDFVIGLGGGRVIDVAKSISFFGNTSADIRNYSDGTLLTAEGKVPSLMIPTTAGSGSEATKFSTIYSGKTKRSLSHEMLLPDHSVLEPAFTEGLSKYNVACAGMDVLCQSIESFWSIHSTEESREYSKSALELVMNYFNKNVNCPDRESRERMLLASHYAGRAINISQTTAVHALSYACTSHFGLPHGHALALTLPYVFEVNSLNENRDIRDRRGACFVRQIMNDLFDQLDVKSAFEAKLLFAQLIKDVHLSTYMADLGISQEGVALIIREGFDSERMQNNPVVLSEKDIFEIFEKLNFFAHCTT